MLRRLGFAMLACITLGLAASPAWADPYTDTIALFKKAGESRDFFNTAYGYAVFPTVGKGGVGVGAAHGNGRVYAKGKYVGDTSMTQLSIGLQLGGQAYSEIVFFQDEAAFKKFTAGNYEFGAEASAIAITASANARATTAGTEAGASGTKNKAATAGSYNAGMAVFTVAKGGLMYEAAVAGQKFSYKPK